MKKIIYKKIALDCARFFLLSILTFGVIIWVLQAVNYLDFVIEDGHGFFVYFNYTILSFPKILSRLFPFATFLSFTYILLKYENKNELVIFWNFGVKKIDFIKFFIKFSIIFVLFSMLLNSIITPAAQDKAISFIRSSNLNFFESILKPRQFIDIIKNLTIYYDKKTENGDFQNIFLKDNSNTNDSQITFAKIGRLEIRGNRKVLVLYDGKTINKRDEKISEFVFSKTDFNMTKLGSRSTTHQKTQETSTMDLVKCLLIFNNLKEKEKPKLNNINNCRYDNLENIYQVLYSRLIKPLYITFLITISLLLILKSKDDHTFRIYKFKIYSFGFLFIIFLETSANFINTNVFQNLFLSILPFIFVFIIYIYFINELKIKKR